MVVSWAAHASIPSANGPCAERERQLRNGAKETTRQPARAGMTVVRNKDGPVEHRPVALANEFCHSPRFGPSWTVELAVLTHGTSISLAEMWGRHLGVMYRNGRAKIVATAEHVLMRFVKFALVHRAS